MILHCILTKNLGGKAPSVHGGKPGHKKACVWPQRWQGGSEQGIKSFIVSRKYVVCESDFDISFASGTYQETIRLG